MTLDDYQAMPRDDRRHVAVVRQHGRIVAAQVQNATTRMNYLGMMLDRWIRYYTKGDVHFGMNMVLDAAKALVHAPDLLFLARARNRRFKNGRLRGPADLLR